LLRNHLLYVLAFVACCSAALAVWAEAPSAAEPADAHRYTVVSECRLLFMDEVHLAGERSGILAEVVVPGTYVSAGSPVARLRDELVRANLAIAEREASNDVEMRFASKVGELSQLKYERAVQANQTLAGTVSDLEVRELRLAAEKSLLQLEQAQHQFAVAGLRRDELRETLRQLQITAPLNAFVRNVHKRPGEVVREGEVIAELINTDRVRVEGYVSAAAVTRIQPGSRVLVELEQPNPQEKLVVLEGRIGFVDVRIEPVTKKVRVWAEVQNTGGAIRDGLTATMRIAHSQKTLESLR